MKLFGVCSQSSNLRRQDGEIIHFVHIGCGLLPRANFYQKRECNAFKNTFTKTVNIGRIFEFPSIKPASFSKFIYHHHSDTARPVGKANGLLG
ncbi:MAG: hypothetical protein EBS84_16795 [Proteobacteria bacterium]|nr:hypothetical protein [Pseudomonadota bacterium]